MYKLVASDMDETFLDGGHHIPSPNIEALRRLRELGVLFVPSSGRGYRSILDNFEGVDSALLEGSYVVSYNGAFVYRYGNPDPLTEHHLDHDLAERLWELGVRRGLAMHAYDTDSHVFVRNVPKVEQVYLSSLRHIVPFEDEDLSRVPVLPKLIFMSEDFAWLHDFGRDVVRPMLGAKADITYSSGRYLEVVPKGVNKGTGLGDLARIAGVGIDETVGFGDSANDLEMIRAAGLGVAVANASDDLRPYCDLILDTHADQGALPELVRRVIEPEHPGE
ncbi:HAD-IIB family hydrolase [uncultured Parolsenella sp.]|uniref:HAD-IIB family hydrolase n=1 Tax=uncultured Parolsenella sp. TaxID=2083008 RepID=UPI0027DD0E02|nr:HAD-IIB family hydrolase [uncultured Parolsenella sp.]